MRELSWWDWLISSIAVFFVGQCSLVHQESPEKAVNSLFQLAHQHKYQALAELCDPQERNDGDTDCLCALSTNYRPHSCPETSHNRISQAEFSSCFATARISGPVRYAEAWGEDHQNGNIASVPFAMNPELCWGKSEETLEMIQAGEKWYLLSF